MLSPAVEACMAKVALITQHPHPSDATSIHRSPMRVGVGRISAFTRRFTVRQVCRRKRPGGEQQWQHQGKRPEQVR